MAKWGAGIIGGGIEKKHARAILIVVAIIVIAVMWKKDKFNRFLPERLRHHTSNRSRFTGLKRLGRYVMGPGGVPGEPGIDLNTSDWV